MPTSVPNPRVAFVHDWLTGMRGGEKCLEALCELFPDATIFTLLHIPGTVSATIERHQIKTSFIQSLPFVREKYRHYLPLFPLAIELFDLRGFDIIVSSNHCVAKGVRTPPDSLHICYCHTPMRYIWHLYHEYFGPSRAGIVTRLGMGAIVGWLRRWDVRTASHPAFFIANSENVRNRIQALYGRDSEVIYPPVNVSAAHISEQEKGYCLMVTAMVPYKRVDIAIDAFNRLGQRLVIAGTGPEEARLRQGAGSTIEFRGWVSDEDIDDLYAGCRALIFPGEEDFGIVPVEAMAHGKPVVAYAKGGALETVRERPEPATGILFAEQTAESLINALKGLSTRRFDPYAIRSFALGFDTAVYKNTMWEYINERWARFHAQRSQP